jgi:hypothetical protein
LTADEQKSEKERCQKCLKPWKNHGNTMEKPWKNQVIGRNPGIPKALMITRRTSLDLQAIGWNMFFWFEGIPKVRDLMDFDEFC